MLSNLHVKNFAIIDEIDIDFGEHLNIMTGETGAGKSIIIGSLNIALGAKVSPEMIGRHGDEAMVEVVFDITDERTLKELKTLGISDDDGQIVISRRITKSRSVNKINGESVSVGVIKKAAERCIDIHGQNDHRFLLDVDKQRDIVDEYGDDSLKEALDRVKKSYHTYQEIQKEIEDEFISDDKLAREISYLTYEKNEIEGANLSPDEMESIDDDYRMAMNSSAVIEGIGKVYKEGTSKAIDKISYALQEISKVRDMNPKASDFEEELLQIEGLIGDVNRGLSAFMQDYSFDEGKLRQLEERLDVIHTIERKYGHTYDEIMSHYKEVDKKLSKYSDYENYKGELEKRLSQTKDELDRDLADLSTLRIKAADALSKSISAALSDLNFAHVDFQIEIRDSGGYSAKGKDEIEFMISTNPGEPRRSLAKIASGGELSRIMLAIKSVFAAYDHIDTLIFDEIDAGISGRTAQCVSEKMNVLSSDHQIICITHLAQIAAMADTHYVIEKKVVNDATKTHIRKLSHDEAEGELARLLGGVEITDAVRENAHEMKALADKMKGT